MERNNLNKVIQFYYLGFVARFLGELNQPNWLLNHESCPVFCRLLFFLKLKGNPMISLSAVLYWELNLLCLCLRSTTPM